MLQVLRKGLKNIVVEDVPEATIGQGEVKIRTAYSLISSGTEIAGLHTDGLVKEVITNKSRISSLIGRAVREQGILSTAKAILDKFEELSITGYAGAGVVIEKAPDVRDLHTGQRVAYGGAQTGHAQIVSVPRNLIVPVPDQVSLKEASLTTVGSIALHALRNANITIGDSVAIIGLGLIGQISVQLAKAAGARVIGIDIRKDRLHQAVSQGAEIALDAAENPASALEAMTNGTGVDAVIVCASSKSAEPLELAVNIARNRARIVVVGAIKMEAAREVLYQKELKLMVSRAYGPGSYDPQYEKKGIDYPIEYVRWTENRNMTEFLRLVQNGAVRTNHIITHELPLEQAATAYDRIAAGEDGIVSVALRYPDSSLEDIRARTKMPIAERREKAFQKGRHLRVGVIGLGNIARWVHLPNVQKHPNLILRGVCTLKGYKAKHLGSRFQSEYCCTDYRQIIEDPDIDAVFICTRHDLHAPLTIQALKAGKHVFVEKPMALNQDDCRTIVQLVRESGLGFMVNLNRRCSPFYERAKKAISGRGPKLISVRMNSPDLTAASWINDSVEGGGAVIGEGCHFFDLMAWFADAEPVSIFAQHLQTSRNTDTNKNNIACTISFNDGSVGSLVYEVVGHRGVGSERVEISAGGTTAVVEDMRRVSIWDGKLSWPKREKSMKSEKGYYSILHSFVEGILEGNNFEKHAQDGARATLCALAALKSAETNLPQKIEKP